MPASADAVCQQFSFVVETQRPSSIFSAYKNSAGRATMYSGKKTANKHALSLFPSFDQSHVQPEFVLVWFDEPGYRRVAVAIEPLTRGCGQAGDLIGGEFGERAIKPCVRERKTDGLEFAQLRGVSVAPLRPERAVAGGVMQEVTEFVDVRKA